MSSRNGMVCDVGIMLRGKGSIFLWETRSKVDSMPTASRALILAPITVEDLVMWLKVPIKDSTVNKPSLYSTVLGYE